MALAIGKWAARLGCLVLLTTAVSCGNSNDDDLQLFTTACPSGVAQIGMGNGISRVLCGCQEAAGTTVLAPDALTCTVPAGTTVIFHYTAQSLRHQVRAESPAGVQAGPSEESPDHSPRIFPVQFTSAGSYAFQDAFDSSVHGTIVVQ